MRASSFPSRLIESKTVKARGEDPAVVPLPSSLMMVSVPPYNSTSCSASDRPRPLPSKHRAQVLLDLPERLGRARDLLRPHADPGVGDFDREPVVGP
jgi:hypothetical protein